MTESTQDLEHLRLLRIFYIIIGIIHFPAALLFSVHVAMGIMMIVAPERMVDAPPAIIGGLFTVVGAFAIVALTAIGICDLLVARFLRTRRHHLFCIVIAALNCTNAPVGTTLGVFTILVLQRPAVKALFAASTR